MASITKTISVAAPAEHVWAALRDFANVHVRLAPGFLTGAEIDTPTSRVVAFFNGAKVREALVTCDDASRRRSTRPPAARRRITTPRLRSLATGRRGCRFVWTTDVLSDEVATYIDAMMERR